MENEKKILRISLILSIMLHLTILGTVVSSKFKRAEEKKIVWVSVRGALPKGTANTSVESESRNKPEFTPEQNNNQSQPPIATESKPQTKEQKAIQENKTVQEKQTPTNRKTENKEKEHKKGEEYKKDKDKNKNKDKEKGIAKSNLNKIEKNNFSRTTKKGSEQKKLKGSEKMNLENANVAGRLETSKNIKAGATQNRSSVRGNTEYTTEEIESKLTSLINEYLEDSNGTESPRLKEDIKLLYAKLVQEIVQKNFEIPPSMKSRRLITTVYVKIDDKGNITDAKVIETSGDRNFDLFVMKALKGSSPFPAPPTELEFLIRFSNE